jgi:DNA-binding transcriptional MerR regulator
MKIHDELIQLGDIPFDASKNAEVTKALRTLGSSIQEVSNIVKLSRRTNKSLFFDFTGSDDILKPFFEKYYNHLSWEEIREKYGERVSRKKISKELLKLQQFFKEYNIEEKNIRYNEERNYIQLFNLSDNVIELLFTKNSKDYLKLIKFLKGLGFSIKKIKGVGKDFTIYLDSVSAKETIETPLKENVETSQEEQFSQFEEDLFTFFGPNGIKKENIKYNSDEQTIYISNFPRLALSELLKNATKGSSAITKFLKKYNFQIKGIDIREEPIKISLKSI